MSLYLGAVKQGFVRLFNQPRLSLPLISTLGLTLASVLTVVAIANTLLIQPLPDIRDETNLYSVGVTLEISDDITVPFLSELRRVAHLSEFFSPELSWGQIQVGGGNVEINAQQYGVTRLVSAMGTPELLGLDLILGQTSQTEGAEQGVWISESLWNSAFAARENALHATLSIGGEERPVLGVLADLKSVDFGNGARDGYQQVWLFGDMQQALMQPEGLNLGARGLTFVRGTADILPSEQALVSWFGRYVESEVPNERARDFLMSKQLTADIQPVRDAFMGDSRMLVLALLIAMLSLLVMACLNLFNMFIAHYQGRNKEFSIQLCMGAPVQRLRNLIFVENLPMFVFATLLGLLSASWLIRLLPVLAEDSLPLLEHIKLDSNSVLIGIGIVFIVNALFSFVALLHVDRVALTDSLNSSGKGTPSQHNQGLGRVLMVFQLVLACLLLTVSLISAKQSFDNVYRDLGFDLPNAFEVALEYKDEQWQQSLDSYETYVGSELYLLRKNMAERLEALEGRVINVAHLPLRVNVEINAYPDPDTQETRTVIIAPWSEGIFTEFGIELLAGRNLREDDQTTNNIVVDKRLAVERFGSQDWQDIVGKPLKLGQDPDDVATVVGVVESIVPVLGIDMNLNLPTLYNFRQRAGSRLSMVVVMPEGQTLSEESLTPLLTGLDARLENVSVDPIQQRWRDMTQSTRLHMYVVLSVAILTLILAVIGVSGLSQMTAAQKRYEMAVRMATGAKQLGLLRLLLKDASLMLSLGLVLGFVASVFGYQYMASQVEQLPAFAWPVSIIVALVLAVAMLVSVVIPSWRTIQSDPMKVLREL